jgi:hypothetical protein
VPGQDGVKVEEILDGLVLYMHSDALTCARVLRGSFAAPRGQLLIEEGEWRPSGRHRSLHALARRRGAPAHFTRASQHFGRRPGVCCQMHRMDEFGDQGPARHQEVAEDRPRGGRRRAGRGHRAAAVAQRRRRPDPVPDIWIDAAQRVRRQTVAIDVKQPLPIKFSLQIDYKRFGVPVDVQAPPAGETVDYSALAGGG